MTETIDLQGQAIGLGTVVAIALLAYGTIVNETIAGYEAFTLAMWAFAATFALVALVHLLYGRMDMALAYTGGAFGWGMLLVGGSGIRILLGMLLLGLAGAYIVVLTLAERKSSDET